MGCAYVHETVDHMEVCTSILREDHGKGRRGA